MRFFLRFRESEINTNPCILGSCDLKHILKRGLLTLVEKVSKDDICSISNPNKHLPIYENYDHYYCYHTACTCFHFLKKGFIKTAWQSII